MCLGGGSTSISETADQVVEQQNNAKLWNYYKTSYEPLIKQYAALTTDPGRKTERERQVAGQITGEVMKNVDPSKVSSNPVQNAKMLANLTATQTGAQVTGQAKERTREIGETQNIIDIGRGKETTAQAGLQDIAAESIKSEIVGKELSLEEQAAWENTIGSVAGTVAGGGLAYAKLKSPGVRTLDWNPQGEQFGAPGS